MNAVQRLPRSSRLGLAAAVGSAALLGGAYYFQYVVGLDPCDLCLWQRYPHMAVIVAGLVAVACFAAPRLALVLTFLAITGLLVTAGSASSRSVLEQHWGRPQSCSGRIPGGLSAEELRNTCCRPIWCCDEVA
jgi:disulfide bond formation protein DsbB